MPGTELGADNVMIGEMDTVPALMELRGHRRCEAVQENHPEMYHCDHC